MTFYSSNLEKQNFRANSSVLEMLGWVGKKPVINRFQFGKLFTLYVLALAKLKFHFLNISSQKNFPLGTHQLTIFTLHVTLGVTTQLLNKYLQPFQINQTVFMNQKNICKQKTVT